MAPNMHPTTTHVQERVTLKDVLLGAIPIVGLCAAIASLTTGLALADDVPKTKSHALRVGMMALVMQSIHLLWIVVLFVE